MSTPSSLCAVQTSTTTGCCGADTAQTASTTTNAPGLPALQYRIGTFTSFRQAMLERVAGVDLMLTAVATALSVYAGAADTTIQVQDCTNFPYAAPFRVKVDAEYMLVIVGAGTTVWTVQRGVDGSTAQPHAPGAPIVSDPANPFATWQPGSHADYHTMFLELWAYLADILTFYQERIANEAYLGTATQRDSMLRLAELIDNHPSPGAGASSVVAFSAQKGKTVAVPLGFAVASKSTPTAPATTFETSAAITAIADHNAMPVATQLQQDQFARQSFANRTVVLQGSNPGLSAGDYLLVVTNEGTASEQAQGLRLMSATIDKASNTTTVVWAEAASTVYDQSQTPVSLYALPVTAAVFGSDAPVYYSLPYTLTMGSASPPINALYPLNWDNPDNPAAFLPMQIGRGVVAAAQRFIYLDAVYNGIKASPEAPGWMIVLADSPGPALVAGKVGSAKSTAALVYHVTDAHSTNATGYALNSKVTRLTTGAAELLPYNTFPIRKAMVLAGSQPVFAATSLPVTSPVSGSTVVLNGLFPLLKAGQKIVVQGTLYANGGAASAELTSELAVLGAAPQVDLAANTTTLTLTRGLGNQFWPASTTVLGNVAEVTQGQTIANEILGSGTGTAFQSFTLKKAPLTYLPSTDSEGLSAVVSTLLVTVNGIEWIEQPNLIDSAPNAHDYMAQTDNAGSTTVSFGDGFNGSVPGTGLSNIKATYRKGLGSSGNLPAGAIVQIAGTMPGLQKVTNPQASTGGADPDSIDDIRTNAPASMTTLGRAISARDYSALALQFPSIQKATAAWIRVDAITRKLVPQPYVQLTVATTDGTPIANSVTAGKLRAYLDSHRNVNIPLRILDYSPVYIDVALTVDILPLYPRQGTLALVQAALNPGMNPDGSAGYFSLASSQFGQSIHLSDLYAAVQGIDGVQDLRITTLRRADLDANTPLLIRDDIFIRPTELAVVRNDPNYPQHGFLSVQLGSGGYADA